MFEVGDNVWVSTDIAFPNWQGPLAGVIEAAYHPYYDVRVDGIAHVIGVIAQILTKRDSGVECT